MAKDKNMNGKSKFNRLYFGLGIGIMIMMSWPASAQQTFSISGKVMSDKLEIPGAVVMLSGFKTTVITNNEGVFTIPNLKPGKYDLIANMLGFSPSAKSVEITNKNVYTTIELKENTTSLNEVVIRVDDNREYNMRVFVQNFIGLSENSEQCEILNPEVIAFSFDAKSRVLYASASEMIEIHNKALGYKIKYLLEEFEADFKTNIVYFAGLPHFESVKARPAQMKNLNKNRWRAYQGSFNHFYKSVYEGKTEEAGFHVMHRRKIPNPDRLPDSLIEAKIQELSAHAFANVKSKVFSTNDSLFFWNKEKRKPTLISFVDTNKIDIHELVQEGTDELKEFTFEHELMVIFDKEQESGKYRFTNRSLTRPPKYKNHQASVIRLLKDKVQFFYNGLLYDPKSVIYEGYWSFEKLADQVPLDENFEDL